MNSFEIDAGLAAIIAALITALATIIVAVVTRRQTSKNEEDLPSKLPKEVVSDKGGVTTMEISADPQVILAVQSALEVGRWFIAPGAKVISEKVGAALSDELKERIDKLFGAGNDEPVDITLLDPDKEATAIQVGTSYLEKHVTQRSPLLQDIKRGMRTLLRDTALFAMADLDEYWQDYGDPDRRPFDQLIAQTPPGTSPQSYVAGQLVTAAAVNGKLDKLIRRMHSDWAARQ